jgi:hypothetical protein
MRKGSVLFVDSCALVFIRGFLLLRYGLEQVQHYRASCFVHDERFKPTGSQCVSVKAGHREFEKLKG